MMSRCCTYTRRSFYFSFLLTKMESLDSAAYKPLLKNKTILTVAGRSSKIKYGFVCNCFRFICTGCVFILKKKNLVRALLNIGNYDTIMDHGTRLYN